MDTVFVLGSSADMVPIIALRVTGGGATSGSTIRRLTETISVFMVVPITIILLSIGISFRPIGLDPETIAVLELVVA